MSTRLERLTLAIKRSGMTQRAIAEQCGMSPTHLGTFLTRLRGNDTSTLEAETMSELCEVLGIRMEWLLSGTEPMQSEVPERGAAAAAAPPPVRVPVMRQPLAKGALTERPVPAWQRPPKLVLHIPEADRYPSRAVVAQQYVGVYDDAALAALLLIAASTPDGADPGPDFWEKRLEEIVDRREAAKRRMKEREQG